MEGQDLFLTSLPALIGLGTSLKDIEGLAVELVLEKSQRNITVAAQLLRMGRAQMSYRLKERYIGTLAYPFENFIHKIISQMAGWRRTKTLLCFWSVQSARFNGL
ncbi:helix-turn-helix domain-containing protein [Pseudomonas sp. Z18(2022)]|uniref:helix-turn-helix domain-containing protein n=1 Tax=Pseudomonas sp. Z18(2022) TaxID=2983410 RepID=UPI003FA75EAF